MEGKPRGYITKDDPVSVPDTAYYLRLVSDGSLIDVAGTPAMAEKPPEADESRSKPAEADESRSKPAEADERSNET